MKKWLLSILLFIALEVNAQTIWYLDRLIPAPITFTQNAAWNTFAANTFVMMYPSKTFNGRTVANATITSDAVGAVAPRKSLIQTYESQPLIAQTVLSGATFSLQVRIAISSTSVTTGQGQIYIRLCNEDGTNLRDVGNAQSTNLTATQTNRTFVVTLGSNLTINDNDRIVLEIGGNESAGTNTTRTFSISSVLGPTATDLPVDNATTTAGNPTFTCSQTLNFRK